MGVGRGVGVRGGVGRGIPHFPGEAGGKGSHRA